MSGFDVSSSERFSGPIRIEAALAEGPEGAIDRVRGRIRAFADAIDAGYFFPARMRSAAPQFGGAGDAVHVSLQVDELPLTALDVLGGMLRDCRHDEVHLRSAHAELDRRQRDLLRDTGWRDYSLFLAPDGLLVGYLETDDYAAAQEDMTRTAVNPRWQAEMSDFFVADGNPDEGFRVLDEVFHLEDQLLAAGLPTHAQELPA